MDNEEIVAAHYSIFDVRIGKDLFTCCLWQLLPTFEASNSSLLCNVPVRDLHCEGLLRVEKATTG